MKTLERMKVLRKLLTDIETQEIEYTEHLHGEGLKVRITVWDRSRGQRLDTQKHITFTEMATAIVGDEATVDRYFKMMCDEMRAAVECWDQKDALEAARVRSQTRRHTGPPR